MIRGWACGLALLGIIPLQQQDLEIIIAASDGGHLIGTCRMETLEFEGTGGSARIAVDKVGVLKFLDSGEEIEGRDGTRLKGRVRLESVELNSTLGKILVLRKDLKQIAFVPKRAGRPRPPEPHTLELLINTDDGNTFVGEAASFKAAIETAHGTFGLTVPPVEQILFMKDRQEVITSDGSRLLGRLKEDDLRIKGDMGDFVVKKNRITHFSVRPARPPKEAPPDLTPSASSPFPKESSRFLLSRDDEVFAIDSVARKIRVWSLPTLEPVRECDLKGRESTLTFSKDGSLVIAAGHINFSVYSADKLQLITTFKVETNIRRVIPLTADEYLVASDGLHRVSVSKRGVVQKTRHPSTDDFGLSPDGSCLYTNWGTLLLPEDRNLEKAQQVQFDSAAHGRFTWSPDGRFALAGFNTRLIRLGSGLHAPMAHVAQFERFSAGCFSLDSRRFFLFQESGHVDAYDTDQLKQTGRLTLRVLARQAEISASGKWLILTGPALDRKDPQSPLVPMGEDQVHCFPAPK